jgi:hypothetical protein
VSFVARAAFRARGRRAGGRAAGQGRRLGARRAGRSRRGRRQGGRWQGGRRARGRALGDQAMAKKSFSRSVNPPDITANVTGMRTARPARRRRALGAAGGSLTPGALLWSAVRPLRRSDPHGTGGRHATRRHGALMRASTDQPSMHARRQQRCDTARMHAPWHAGRSKAVHRRAGGRRAPATTMMQALAMIPRSSTAKFTVAPTRPKSTGIVTKRQNQRSWRSTTRATCGPLSPARARACAQASPGPQAAARRPAPSSAARRDPDFCVCWWAYAAGSSQAGTKSGVQ